MLRQLEFCRPPSPEPPHLQNPVLLPPERSLISQRYILWHTQHPNRWQTQPLAYVPAALNTPGQSHSPQTVQSLPQPPQPDYTEPFGH